MTARPDRHDPLTLRLPRSERETHDDPYDWFEGAEPQGDMPRPLFLPPRRPFGERLLQLLAWLLVAVLAGGAVAYLFHTPGGIPL